MILLRLDFDEFDIAQPFTCGSSSTSVACTTTDGPLIGDCIYDSMTVTTPGSPAPPIICGYNTGQHMYVEASEQCNKIIFNIGLQSAATSSRAWMIRVTQFDSTQVCSTETEYRAHSEMTFYYDNSGFQFCSSDRLPAVDLWRQHRHHPEF